MFVMHVRYDIGLMQSTAVMPQLKREFTIRVAYQCGRALVYAGGVLSGVIPARGVSYTPHGEILISIHDVDGLYAVDRPSTA